MKKYNSKFDMDFKGPESITVTVVSYGGVT